MGHVTVAEIFSPLWQRLARSKRSHLTYEVSSISPVFIDFLNVECGKFVFRFSVAIKIFLLGKYFVFDFVKQVFSAQYPRRS